jgi:hypothetical protein
MLNRWEGRFVLRVLFPASCVFLWLNAALSLVLSAQFNGNLTYDLFLARTGNPATNHAVSMACLLSIFPLAWWMLKGKLGKTFATVPAFFLTIGAWGFHETTFQFPYWVDYQSLGLNASLFWQGVGLDCVWLAIIFGVLYWFGFRGWRFYFLWLAPWLVYLGVWFAGGFPISVSSHLLTTPSFAITPLNLDLRTNAIETCGWILMLVQSVLVLQLLDTLTLSQVRLPGIFDEPNTGENRLSRRSPLRRSGDFSGRNHGNDYVQLWHERDGDTAPAPILPARAPGRNRCDSGSVPKDRHGIEPTLAGLAPALLFLAMLGGLQMAPFALILAWLATQGLRWIWRRPNQ